MQNFQGIIFYEQEYIGRFSNFYQPYGEWKHDIFLHFIASKIDLNYYFFVFVFIFF